jgi:hypothetical protein
VHRDFASLSGVGIEIGFVFSILSFRVCIRVPRIGFVFEKQLLAVGGWLLAGGIGFVFEKQLLAFGGWLLACGIGFVFSFWLLSFCLGLLMGWFMQRLH